MKKGCLIALGLGVIAVAAAIGLVYYKVNQQAGLSAAPVVSHETLATPQTRLRVAIDTQRLAPFIADYVPPSIPLVAGYAIDLRSRLTEFLPYEIALLAGSDYADGRIGLTLFCNEQRGGPAIAEILRQENPLRNLPFVQWAADGIKLRERGVLAADGAVAIPDGVEGVVLESFTHDAPAQPLTIGGGHQIEAAFDNRNGDLLTLIASGAQAAGEDWKGIFATQEFQMAKGIIVGLTTGRLTADLRDANTAAIHLEIGADEKTGKQLPFIVNAILMPGLTAKLAEGGLTLKGTPAWNAAKGMFEGDFTLTGIKAVLDRYVPRPAAA